MAACRAARNPWLAPFVALAIETGMRRSELLGLQWPNVDLERRIAFLPDDKERRPPRRTALDPCHAILRTCPCSAGRVFGA